MVVRLAIEFRLLGPVQASVAGRPVLLGGGQRRALLAVLLLHANRVVPAERLTTLLWGPRPPRTARSSLHVRMSQLRRVFAEAEAASAAGAGRPAEAGGGDDRLVFRPPGYLLRVASDELDLHRFGRLADAGRDLLAAGDPRRAAELLHEALDLWRGAALEDVSVPGLAEHRARLDQRRLAVRADRVDAELRLGRHAALVEELEELVGEHPLDERLRGQLMVALYRCGRQSEALATYREARRVLVDGLGLEPGPRLRHLEQAILTADPSIAAPTPPDPAVPADRATDPLVVPAQLLADVTDFTGRTDSLGRLDSLLTGDPAHRPAAVVIAGTAGVGKTALAVHWAHRISDRFPDGQLHVNLRGFEPSGTAMAPTEALRVVLDGLAVPPQRIPVSLDGQASLYRSLLAGRRMLILLDNARDAEQVRPLLPGTPGCLAVVTSRNELSGLVAAEGAHLLTLDVLTTAEARQLLARRVGAARVAAEPAAVDEIITRCAGLPLALAIVAARAAARPAFALGTLAADLRGAGNELDALDGGDPVTDVRAVFSWSYRTLGTGAGRLFRLLGLHPGPDIATAAAASLAGIPSTQVRRHLAELTRAHLATEHVPGRFSLHDLLRVYAAELAHAHDSDDRRRAALQRMLDHYVHTADVAGHLMNLHGERLTPAGIRPGVAPEPIADHEHAMAWFDAEHAVLLAVFGKAADAGFDRQVVELAWALSRFVNRRGYWHELATTQHAALKASQRLDDRSLQARVHRVIGLANARLARYDDALAHLRQALRFAAEVGERTAQAHTHMTFAQVFARQGDHRQALGHARQAYSGFLATDHRYGQANALNAIGWYQALLGDYRQALAMCTRALALSEALGDHHGVAGAWDSIGYAHHHLDDHRRAVACYQRAVELFRQLGDRYFEADTLIHLGDAHQATGDCDQARQAWQRALSLFHELGHPDAERARAKLSVHYAGTA